MQEKIEAKIDIVLCSLNVIKRYCESQKEWSKCDLFCDEATQCGLSDCEPYEWSKPEKVTRIKY